MILKQVRSRFLGSLCNCAPFSVEKNFFLFCFKSKKSNADERLHQSQLAPPTHYSTTYAANEEENTLRGHRNSSFSASHQKLNRSIKYDEVW
ncbi:hypothetical protein I7I48_10037 [Histoplasma ohiense]|nr:hypothetical protein I7I48_10037 [Histoplasma ohiense (nom. inval.)]